MVKLTVQMKQIFNEPDNLDQAIFQDVDGEADDIWAANVQKLLALFNNPSLDGRSNGLGSPESDLSANSV